MSISRAYDNEHLSMSHRPRVDDFAFETELPLKWGRLLSLGILLLVAGTFGAMAAVWATLVSVLESTTAVLLMA